MKARQSISNIRQEVYLPDVCRMHIDIKHRSSNDNVSIVIILWRIES